MLYLMPVSYNYSEEEIRQQASTVFSNVHIPNDVEDE